MRRSPHATASVVQSLTTLERQRSSMRSTYRRIGLALAAVAAIAMMVVALANSAGPVGSGTASATKAACGKGTGKKATGAPIKLGGIDMLIPGVDFTTIG